MSDKTPYAHTIDRLIIQPLLEEINAELQAASDAGETSVTIAISAIKWFSLKAHITNSELWKSELTLMRDKGINVELDYDNFAIVVTLTEE